MADQHLVDENPERPVVDAPVVALAEDKLGSEVLRRAAQRERAVRDDFGEAEVAHFNVPARVDQEVLRLEVAVRDLLRVEVDESGENARGVEASVLRRLLAAAVVQAREELAALDELHEEVEVVGVLERRVAREDERVVRAHQQRLFVDDVALLPVRHDERLGQDLHRVVLTRLLVRHQLHAAEGAAPQCLLHDEVGEADRGFRLRGDREVAEATLARHAALLDRIERAEKRDEVGAEHSEAHHRVVCDDRRGARRVVQQRLLPKVLAHAQHFVVSTLNLHRDFALCDDVELVAHLALRHDRLARGAELEDARLRDLLPLEIIEHREGFDRRERAHADVPCHHLVELAFAEELVEVDLVEEEARHLGRHDRDVARAHLAEEQRALAEVLPLVERHRAAVGEACALHSALFDDVEDRARVALRDDELALRKRRLAQRVDEPQLLRRVEVFQVLHVVEHFERRLLRPLRVVRHDVTEGRAVELPDAGVRNGGDLRTRCVRGGRDGRRGWGRKRESARDGRREFVRGRQAGAGTALPCTPRARRSGRAHTHRRGARASVKQRELAKDLAAPARVANHDAVFPKLELARVDNVEVIRDRVALLDEVRARRDALLRHGIDKIRLRPMVQVLEHVELLDHLRQEGSDIIALRNNDLVVALRDRHLRVDVRARTAHHALRPRLRARWPTRRLRRRVRRRRRSRRHRRFGLG